MRGRPTRAAGRARALLLIVGMLAGVSGCQAEVEAPSEGPQPAPEFNLARLGGGEVSLAELRGKTVVLDFWATWCPPCEFQVPALNRFYDAHSQDSDVVVFGISVDHEGPEVVEAWVTEKDVRYPILLGGEDLARRFGALGFPTLFVLSPDGTIHSQHVGLIETDSLEEALAAQRTAGSI